MKRILALLLVTCFMVGCNQLRTSGATQGNPKGVVVLDIGHFIGGEGAVTPGEVRGRRISECAWWYQYCYFTKKVIEDAGYRCIVCNRGNTPTTEPLASYARRAKVVQLRKPDQGGTRYPSHYHPDRVASGIVSADYAIYRQAACAVFLHHNSSGGWVNGGSNSMILCNKHNGGRLANALAQTLETKILNHGMENGQRGCKIVTRSVDADRAAGWLNACDDSGIPAAVIEAAYLNNRHHAAFLADEANARRYAEAIGHGVVRYLRTQGSEPRHYRVNENEPDEGSFGFAAESRRLKVPGAKHLLH